MRQRADGTWTQTSIEYDAAWYWPIGTRVSVRTRDGQIAATITKANPTTANLTTDDGRTFARVAFAAMERL